jgi:hypothetical protein
MNVQFRQKALVKGSDDGIIDLGDPDVLPGDDVSRIHFSTETNECTCGK